MPPRVLLPRMLPPRVLLPKMLPPRVLPPKLMPPRVLLPRMLPPRVLLPKMLPPRVLPPKLMELKRQHRCRTRLQAPSGSRGSQKRKRSRAKWRQSRKEAAPAAAAGSRQRPETHSTSAAWMSMSTRTIVSRPAFDRSRKVPNLQQRQLQRQHRRQRLALSGIPSANCCCATGTPISFLHRGAGANRAALADSWSSRLRRTNPPRLAPAVAAPILT
uniref:Uncharacterized protein n=1 Tax=Macrostomum lignano TaxID=282301 RepID=A0A1I8HQ65_9PLAT